MKLDTFKYIYNRGELDEWKIEECQLNQINLIVGKNATGKSRIVEFMNVLSMLLAGNAKICANQKKDEWHLFFDRDTEISTEYILRLENGHVIQEKLIIGTQIFIDRDETGEGDIIAEAVGKDKKIRFQTPITELAVVKRRDTIQHPFLEGIYQWASSVRFYKFGTQMGKDTLTKLPVKIDLLKANTDFKNYNHVVGIFAIGEHTYKYEFTKAILADMRAIGYNISEIGTRVPRLIEDIFLEDGEQGRKDLLRFLYVKEQDLETVTEQGEMSQGMFRVLSLLIQVNYSLLSDKPSCIIIDDIGEGLDFQRSSAIIKLLIEKAKTGLIQLIMTTNDENIMNGVPLEYWSVIERQPGVAKLHNYANSPEQFEQFKHIGLNNFDFFASEFYLQKPNSEEVID
jgi:AAA15 family ATPase/GTPase